MEQEIKFRESVLTAMDIVLKQIRHVAENGEEVPRQLMNRLKLLNDLLTTIIEHEQ